MSLIDLIIPHLSHVVRNPGDTIQARCPQCAAEGGDTQGVHLRVWPSGAFRCAKMGDDKEHNRAIRKLIRGDGSESSDTSEAALLLNAETEYVDGADTKLDMVKTYEESLLTKLLPDYTYWIGRGIDEKVLSRIGGGVASADEKSKLSGRYVFPCRDERERIVGWAGRLIIDSSFAPKYKIIGRKATFLFPPISVVERAARASGDLILTEGQGDCLALMSAGIDQVYSLFGVSLSSKLVGRIVALAPKRVIIATNNEASGIGNRAAEKIKSRLSSFVLEDKIIVALPPLKDFGMMTKEAIQEWYSNVGKTSPIP